jgi:hypothetical protein
MLQTSSSEIQMCHNFSAEFYFYLFILFIYLFFFCREIGTQVRWKMSRSRIAGPGMSTVSLLGIAS